MVIHYAQRIKHALKWYNSDVNKIMKKTIFFKVKIIKMSKNW